MSTIPTHALIQRVLVRMLYDPRFRDAVFADPAATLGPLGVPEAHMAQIVAHDPRAFAVDPWRGHRAVTAVMREAAVSVLALTRLGVGANDHLAFIASDAFHRCVMERGLLVDAFFDYLDEELARARPASRRERQAAVVLGAMVALERAIARVRRPAKAAEGRVAVGQARALELPAGASAVWARAHESLGADPVAAVVSGGQEAKRALAALFGDENLASGAREHLLVDGSTSGSEPMVSFVGESLVVLMRRAEGGASRDELIAVAEREGASRAEAEEILDELIAEGLLLS
jgi:hypothetical protein